MAAFDRIQSGIPEMDEELESIRLGDNVVWRLSHPAEFRYIAEPFVRKALRDGRRLLYVHFAPVSSYSGWLEEIPSVVIRPEEIAPDAPTEPVMEVVPVALSHRFEIFTVQIHNIIERAGREAFFLFDCLSELQTAWSTDLMMSNFFRVTCPYLYERNTVAYFPLLRGMHSAEAIAKIRETTQLFLDVFSDSSPGQTILYVRPLKVWNRESDTLFLPHRYVPDTGEFCPILDGVAASHFYQLLGRSRGRGTSPRNRDYWERFFDDTRERFEDGEGVREQCSRMCQIMMTRDERMRVLVRKHFRPDDYFAVHDRMIGTGMIGGKACGMLLARAIIRNEQPELFSRLEPHDSFYVGSDVFYSYIVENQFWELRVRQRTDEGYFALAEELAEAFRKGTFSRELEESFERILEYYGRDPFIVRSSSILEDGFGNAFAGIYESVFCSNKGTLEERMRELENAVRTVYASTMSRTALDYRKRRGLDKREEQMSLLIQRVSGSHYGPYYMPCAAGVGFSYSPYRFLKTLDPSAGMLRLVAGLGTSAVDRTEGSYPRLVSLDQPELTAAKNASERHQFSQRRLETMDEASRSVVPLTLKEVRRFLPGYLARALLEHDTEAERILRERGEDRTVEFLSCRGLVRRADLMADMRLMLAVIQKEYGQPVDTEFTVNLAEHGEYVINLLQCRPLQVLGREMAGDGDVGQKGEQDAGTPWAEDDSVLLHCVHASMGLTRTERLDGIVYIDPDAYTAMPYARKTRVAGVIGRINWHFRGRGLHLALLAPGRIGTSSPELGVPTTFADISEFDMIVEIAGAGYHPELSYGSHFFQDLVEADILYAAVFEDERTLAFHPELLEQAEGRGGEHELLKQAEGRNDEHDSLAAILPDDAAARDVVKLVLYQDGTGPLLLHSMEREETMIRL